MITTHAAPERTDLEHTASTRSDVDACACDLYDAECALHAAHQSGVEAWITAAAEKLHQAVEAYLRVVADTKTSRQACS